MTARGVWGWQEPLRSAGGPAPPHGGGGQLTAHTDGPPWPSASYAQVRHHGTRHTAGRVRNGWPSHPLCKGRRQRHRVWAQTRALFKPSRTEIRAARPPDLTPCTFPNRETPLLRSDERFRQAHVRPEKLSGRILASSKCVCPKYVPEVHGPSVSPECMPQVYAPSACPKRMPQAYAPSQCPNYVCVPECVIQLRASSAHHESVLRVHAPSACLKCMLRV